MKHKMMSRKGLKKRGIVDALIPKANFAEKKPKFIGIGPY